MPYLLLYVLYQTSVPLPISSEAVLYSGLFLPSVITLTSLYIRSEPQ